MKRDRILHWQFHLDTTKWRSVEYGVCNEQLQESTWNMNTWEHTRTHARAHAHPHTHNHSLSLSYSFSLTFIIKLNMHTSLKCNYQTLNMPHEFSHATPPTLSRRNMFCGKEVGACKREANALGSTQPVTRTKAWTQICLPRPQSSNRNIPLSLTMIYFSSLMCRCHRLSHVFVTCYMNFWLGIFLFILLIPFPQLSHHQLQSPLNVHL